MAEFRVPHIVLPEYISLWARAHPNKPAVACGGEQLSWGQFSAAVDGVAAGLAARGVAPGDCVAILAANSLDTIVAYWGTLRAGAVVASLSTMLRADALIRMIRDSSARVVIAGGVDPVPCAELRAAVSDIPAANWIALGACLPDWAAFGDLAADPADLFPAAAIDAESVCNIIYSSGTTGLPKGIVHTHACRTASAYLLGMEQRFDSRCITLGTTALYSNTGWSLMIMTFLVGGTFMLMPKYDARAWLEIVAAERVSHTLMVPVQFRTILDEPDFAAADTSSLKMICTVGSSMPINLKREVETAFACGLFEIYGLTEGFVTLRKPEDPPEKMGSVGRPGMGNDLRILSDEGRTLSPGEAGEIIGHSPMLMRGYHNQPEQTEAAIWRDPETGRTFLRSGDVGRFDEDGYFWLLDRKKDMIVSGGYNVFPADIERVLGEHEDVGDVAVIAIPHVKWGETPLALVVPRGGAAVKNSDLATWVNERLGKHQRVARVEYRDSLPRNPAGKILKRELSRPYWPARND